MSNSLAKKVKLRRSVTLLQLTLFGTGTILGAGVYVLIGKVAAETNIYAPFAFIVAAIIAAITALTYAELTARYPKSAGEAAYVLAAYNSNKFSALVGWLLIAAGIISSATLVIGVTGYISSIIDVPETVISIACITFIGILAIKGINESMMVAGMITLIEIGGLILVIFVAFNQVSTDHIIANFQLPPVKASIWFGIISGAFLAFYAFVGFEDMVNIAEEVINPTKTIPLAIILAIVISTVLYVLVALAAISFLPIDLLAASRAPFALLMERAGHSATLIILISLIAITNGILVQMIMVSRVLYGMANQNTVPAWFGRVSHLTHTPVNATLFTMGIITITALLFPIVFLAKFTSLIVLSTFTLVNLALIKLKIQAPAPQGIIAVPIAIPILGVLSCGGLIVFALSNIKLG